MRVLLVAPEFPPMIGGMETYAWELACRLSPDHDVAVLTKERSKEAPGIRSLPYFIDQHSIRQAAKEIDPDCVHILNGGLAEAIPMLKNEGYRVVVTVHGKDTFKPWFSSSDRVRENLMEADKVIAVSPLVRERLEQWGVLDAEVIPHGVDSSTHTPMRKVSSIPTVLSVGRVVPRKGYEHVISALAQLPPRLRRTVYRVVGPITDPAYKDGLVMRAVECGVANRVEIVGTTKSLSEEYSLADVFIMPSHETSPGDIEGFGLVALEAMASGLPVIISSASGASAYVGGGGIVVESQKDLQSALADLLEDCDRREHMGQIARGIAEGLSWDRCIEETTRCYGEKR